MGSSPAVVVGNLRPSGLVQHLYHNILGVNERGEI
jgi:hypothetical protein